MARLFCYNRCSTTVHREVLETASQICCNLPHMAHTGTRRGASRSARNCITDLLQAFTHGSPRRSTWCSATGAGATETASGAPPAAAAGRQPSPKPETAPNYKQQRLPCKISASIRHDAQFNRTAPCAILRQRGVEVLDVRRLDHRRGAGCSHWGRARRKHQGARA